MIDVILALLMVALLVLVVLSRKEPGKFNLPIIGIIVVAVVAFILKMTIFNVSEAKMTQRYSASVAYRIGKEVRENMPNARRILIIQDPEYVREMRGRPQAQTAGFMKGLKNDSAELVYYTPQIPYDYSKDEDEIVFWYSDKRWRKDFAQWFLQQKEFDVMVSFVGLPRYSSKKLLDAFPPIYMRHTGRGPASELAITAAGKLKGYSRIRPGLNSDHTAPAGSNLDKIFDARFVWVDIEE